MDQGMKKILGEIIKVNPEVRTFVIDNYIKHCKFKYSMIQWSTIWVQVVLDGAPVNSQRQTRLQ